MTQAKYFFDVMLKLSPNTLDKGLIKLMKKRIRNTLCQRRMRNK